jgi:FO synthase
MKLSQSELLKIAEDAPIEWLLKEASRQTVQAHGKIVTYSRKVFIPLTKLCRDVCHYCTFTEQPRAGKRAYLTRDEVLAIARSGAKAGCHEALFTLGDKPELRYRAAIEELAALGHSTTLSYVAEMCRAVLEETGLLPHVNAGVMSREDIEKLRTVSISQGLMLESISQHLCEPGGVHYGSPDKQPEARLATIRAAGEARVPFTSGILIGIGESRQERIASLLALRDLHSHYGHLQEIIIQNFRAKPRTKRANAPEPDSLEMLWTIAMARLILGPEMNIQAPPNLMPDEYGRFVEAGINDWGGVSPVTVDHVNPEAAWPEITQLERTTGRNGRVLVPRLTAYPGYLGKNIDRWIDRALHKFVHRQADSEGYAREDTWSVGTKLRVPSITRTARAPSVDRIIANAVRGDELSVPEISTLFRARGDEVGAICHAANKLRGDTVGETVTYVVTRNINYTNVCYFKCRFCAFSKGKMSENLRGRPYNLSFEEISRHASEAWERGATEVCLQGGIHPEYTGEHYLNVCRAVRDGASKIHIHAFSALEISQGAATLGISPTLFLEKLKAAGLGTLPGTAAEILVDDVRARLCPDKLKTDEWLSVIEAAHRLGIRTTATVMFGHIESVEDWAQHLLRIRKLQCSTGGFTEFVPLPFVHMEAPIYLKGYARKGPTFREAILMHAVSRLALNPLIRNIQTSWVKMGLDGAKAALQSGANDLGGTLMNESISRAAGTEHGQELSPSEMEKLICDIERWPKQRTTIYGLVDDERRAASFSARPLLPAIEPKLASVEYV